MNNLERYQKVFGLGLSRTGTTSLSEALNMLGIRTIHYPHDQTTYDELKNGDYRLSILEKYQAVVDIPVVPYYAQLDTIYPNSKFILTIRDKGSWLRSIETHFRVTDKGAKRDPQLREYAEFIRACVYGSLRFNRDRFRYVYDTHLRNVREYFDDRPEDLLVMDICGGDGWEKLCPFLGASAPKVKFPHENRWAHDFLLIPQDIAGLVPLEDAFVLVDNGMFGSKAIAGRRAVPFLERDGQYWGPPPDDKTAIKELERLRRSGVGFVVFAWPAFWWLDYYSGLCHYLYSQFCCVLENDRLVAFDLRP